jgi:hypothetical protein
VGYISDFYDIRINAWLFEPDRVSLQVPDWLFPTIAASCGKISLESSVVYSQLRGSNTHCGAIGGLSNG